MKHCLSVVKLGCFLISCVVLLSSSIGYSVEQSSLNRRDRINQQGMIESSAFKPQIRLPISLRVQTLAPVKGFDGKTNRRYVQNQEIKRIFRFDPAEKSTYFVKNWEFVFIPSSHKSPVKVWQIKLFKNVVDQGNRKTARNLMGEANVELIVKKHGRNLTMINYQTIRFDQGVDGDLIDLSLGYANADPANSVAKYSRHQLQ
jgi:hypothetical protein